MSRVYYSKLVRDGIKDNIERNGESCEVRVITDTAEFEQELLKKVREEAEGLASARNRAEFLSEYADLMVVLDALTTHYEFTEADIRVVMAENVQKEGLFKKRYYLHWSDAGKYEK